GRDHDKQTGDTRLVVGWRILLTKQFLYVPANTLDCKQDSLCPWVPSKTTASHYWDKVVTEGLLKVFGVGDHQRMTTERPSLCDDAAPRRVNICGSYRLKVTFICQYGLLCSFASQSITAASLLTMMRHNSDFNATDTIPYGSYTPSGLGATWLYHWARAKESAILAFFFGGYYIMQIPAGLLTMRYGGKRVALVGALVLACLQGLAIGAAPLGYPYFVTVITAAGVATSCLYSPIMAILADWIPPQESSRLTSLAASGVGVGVAAVFALSAGTSHTDFIGGWPVNFMGLGGILLLFCGVWAVFIDDCPTVSERISPEELEYIEWSFASKGIQHRTRDQPRRAPSCRLSLKIMMSAPVNAIAVSQFGSDWVQYFLITVFPLYLKFVRHMDVATADYLCGLPWLAVPPSSYGASKLVDYIRAKQILSTTRLRKIADFFAKVVPGALLVGIVLLPDDHPTTNALLIVCYVGALVTIGVEGSSWLPNILDLSANYASFISAFSQVLSLIGSFVLPLVVGAMTPHNTSAEWTQVMYLTAGILTVTWLIYVFIASSEPQHWREDNAETAQDGEREESDGNAPLEGGNADDEGEGGDSADPRMEV
ncbi:hypothetical protein BaRGS_00020908, partial [Batillaria attramentaria]